MSRTHSFMPAAFLAIVLFAASPAYEMPTCWWGVTDITSVSGSDPDGSYWEYVTFWYGWSCTDGYLDSERPYDPSTVGRPVPTPTPAPVPAPTGCSLSSCLSECDAHYMADAGIEVIGDTIIEHYNVECGILCRQMANLDWRTCRGLCTTDCDLP